MNERSLVFLAETTKFNMGPLAALAAGIQQMISDIRSQNPGWIESVFVIGFDGTGQTYYTNAPLDNEQGKRV